MYIDENRNVVFESNDYYIRYHISQKLIDIPGATLLTFNEYLKHTTAITDATGNSFPGSSMKQIEMYSGS